MREAHGTRCEDDVDIRTSLDTEIGNDQKRLVRVATPTPVIDAGWVVRGIRKVLELTSWTGKREKFGWL